MVIGYLFGFFAILLVFLVLAIIFAKSKASVVLYLIGAVIQLISLIGNGRNPFIAYTDLYTTEWVIYVILLVIAGLIIGARRAD